MRHRWNTIKAGKRILSSALALLVGLFGGMLPTSQSAWADGGDFHLDFVAANPSSYDHLTGGGEYNNGKNPSVVESLEGGDFACGDIVTFLTQISVDGGAAGSQTIRLNFEFTAHSTGQQGVALNDNNSGGFSAAINTNPPDTGTINDGGSTATVVANSEGLNGAEFVKPTAFLRSVDVTDLEAGETVVVRTDVQIDCNGQSPTGNMQARLASASVVAPVADTINVGDQTVPFKHVGDIKQPTCGPKPLPPCPPPPK